MGGDVTRQQPNNGIVAGIGLAMKWAPEQSAIDTAWGRLRFGAKLGLGTTRQTGQHWRTSRFGALALATLQVSETASVHVNAGPLRDRETASTSTLLNTAIVWAPTNAGLLFVEAQANDRPATLGNVLRTAGARWWLVKDTVGLDVTASRTSGSTQTNWSIGFGWYGL